MISMFATLSKQERARISGRTIAGLKVARAKGKALGRPPLPEETVQKVLSLNRHAGIGARKIAQSTGLSVGHGQCNLDQIPTTDLLSTAWFESTRGSQSEQTDYQVFTTYLNLSE
jgi:hypothetical protein